MSTELDQLRRIERRLRRLVYDPRVDLEQLAVDVWLECPEPTLTLLRWRSRDALRAMLRQTAAVEGYKLTREDHANGRVILPVSDVINLLVARARLDRLQKAVLFNRFWLGLSFEEVSEKVGLPLSSTMTTYHSAIQRLREIKETLT